MISKYSWNVYCSISEIYKYAKIVSGSEWHTVQCAGALLSCLKIIHWQHSIVTCILTRYLSTFLPLIEVLPHHLWHDYLQRCILPHLSCHHSVSHKVIQMGFYLQTKSFNCKPTRMYQIHSESWNKRILNHVLG